MNEKEKLNWIDLKITYANLTLSLKNGIQHVGYFEPFDDSFDLSKKNQMRFVRNLIDSDPLKIEKEKTGRLNPKFSIIINVDEISMIDGRTWDELFKLKKV